MFCLQGLTTDTPLAPAVLGGTQRNPAASSGESPHSRPPAPPRADAPSAFARGDIKGERRREGGKGKGQMIRLSRSHSKPPSCDIKATSMRVASQAVATSMRPQSHPKATPKPGLSGGVGTFLASLRFATSGCYPRVPGSASFRDVSKPGTAANGAARSPLTSPPRLLRAGSSAIQRSDD